MSLKRKKRVKVGGLQTSYISIIISVATSLMDSHGESWQKRWTAGVFRSERYAVKGVCEGGLHRRGQEVSACVGAGVHHYQWTEILVDLGADWIWSRCIRLAGILMGMVLSRCLIRKATGRDCVDKASGYHDRLTSESITNHEIDPSTSCYPLVRLD